MDIFISEHPIAIAGNNDGFYSIRYLTELKLNKNEEKQNEREKERKKIH